MRSFWNVLLLVIFLGLVAYGGAIKERDNHSSEIAKSAVVIPFKGEIDREVLSLAQQDLTLPTSGYHLDVLPIDYTLSSAEIADMLAPGRGQHYPLVYRTEDIGTYTMSAPAIDGDHYLVNTYLEGYAPFEVSNVMTPLYILSQRKSYQLDANQYAKRADVWQSSRQAFYYPRGDCEDHAIVLADWLIEKGEDARVVLGEVEGGGGHAWVVLFKHGKEYLLEATQKEGLSRTKPYPVAILYRDYYPRYMFNRAYFWENTGTKYTTKYASQQWEKNSQYRSIKRENKPLEGKMQ